MDSASAAAENEPRLATSRSTRKVQGSIMHAAYIRGFRRDRTLCVVSDRNWRPEAPHRPLLLRMAGGPGASGEGLSQGDVPGTVRPCVESLADARRAQAGPGEEWV
ncbi:hypothetical protein Vse01_07170 [Micromonospora sediminimaris]|uniref:Uncharacterized protein n=1 Tax=Micromonospora sediminimaris TaxID=547162 RepID=A0A9W5UN80_9ACTN|nr:hypothetical protein Vse01_07170 [Micromonospora sediminimaris]